MKIFNIKYWEGPFLDLWSVPHMLTGVLIALLVVVLKVSFLTGFFITLAVAILWELFEIATKVYEIKTNSVVDIVIALVGYSLFFYIPKWFNLDNKGTTTLLAILLVVFLATVITGWIAYKHYAPK
jgi:hypothetical protein